MSKTPEELLLDWSRAGFVGLDRDQLKQAAEMLKVEYAPQTRSDTLQARLRDAIGMVDGTLAASSVQEIAKEVGPKHQLSLHQTPPNLTPAGRWGGRYRRVRLVRTDYYKNFLAFPVSWEGVTKYFHFDVEVDMPWPYYEAIRNMVEVVILKDLASDGHSTVTREVTNQVLPFSDLGDVPGTEQLPTSMLEYVAWLAVACGNFAETSRRDLLRVLTWLHGQGIRARAREMTDDDLRDRILTFVGIDVYAEAA